MNAITTKDLNEAVEVRKLQLIHERNVRAMAAIDLTKKAGFKYKDATILVNLIDAGTFSGIKINYGKSEI